MSEHLAKLETPMMYDNGDSFCLVCNEDQSGVVWNAAYGDLLEKETKDGY